MKGVERLNGQIGNKANKRSRPAILADRGVSQSAALLDTTARLTLANSAAIRYLKAVSVCNIILPSDSEYVLIAKNATKQWMETKAPKGPPYTHVALALLQQLLKSDKVMQTERQWLSKFLAQLSEGDALLLIKTCRICKCFDAAKTRLEIQLENPLDRAQRELIRVLLTEGAQLCAGPAPRAPLEREAQALLSAQHL